MTKTNPSLGKRRKSVVSYSFLWIPRKGISLPSKQLVAMAKWERELFSFSVLIWKHKTERGSEGASSEIGAL